MTQTLKIKGVYMKNIRLAQLKKELVKLNLELELTEDFLTKEEIEQDIFNVEDNIKRILNQSETAEEALLKEIL